MPQWQDDGVEMTLGNQASDSCPGERRKRWHKPTSVPAYGKATAAHLQLRPTALVWVPPAPAPPTHPSQAAGQQHLPHLKRRNSELIFTFPVERQDRCEAGKLGVCATPPAPLTFWEDVHPVPVVELIQNEVHSLLVDAISCREKAAPSVTILPGRPPCSGSSRTPSSPPHDPCGHPPIPVPGDSATVALGPTTAVVQW